MPSPARRLLDRFLEDSSFVPSSNELAGLRSQIVTLEDVKDENHFKLRPRLFTKLRSFLVMENSLEENLTKKRTLYFKE